MEQKLTGAWGAAITSLRPLAFHLPFSTNPGAPGSTQWNNLDGTCMQGVKMEKANRTGIHNDNNSRLLVAAEHTITYHQRIADSHRISLTTCIWYSMIDHSKSTTICTLQQSAKRSIDVLGVPNKAKSFARINLEQVWWWSSSWW